MFSIRKKSRQSKVVVVIILFLCTGFLLSNSPASESLDNKSSFSPQGKFAGNDACKSCHRAYYESYIHTAHSLTSTPGSTNSIKGSFEEGKNFFAYNKWTEVKLEKKVDGLYQTGYAAGQELQSEKMDITIGSGRKGQTYLYWKENSLYQLPVSYFKPANSWCNSPGFPTSMFKFYRIIPGQCMECHASDATLTKEDEEGTVFDKQSLVLGITCERCHGPAVEHVAFHQQNPGAKNGQHIVNAANLSRELQLDACAFCHSGFRKQVQPSFSFTVGKKLDDYSKAAYNSDSTAVLDVHGNQYGLLSSSKCFQKSQMTCSSCHNVHEIQFEAPKLFSTKCMSCHNSDSKIECTINTDKDIELADNCVDCHMPALPSAKLLLQLPNKQALYPDFVRTHRIGIYYNNAREFIEKKGGVDNNK
jgi:nitrate/TMAO reductase-like tetraheme cytochrome c subunit